MRRLINYFILIWLKATSCHGPAKLAIMEGEMGMKAGVFDCTGRG